MLKLLQKILIHNAPLKIVSLLMGYTFWHMLAASIPVTRTYSVPVCFYNTDTLPAHAPETVAVTLCAKRSALEAFMHENPAVHLDATVGADATEYCQAVTRDNLFLPEGIKLVSYTPTPLLITTH